MEQAVSQTVSPSDPPETKLKKIYARVQQLKNTSYEVRKTAEQAERDKDKAASNVEEVWKKGADDGVQLTWLFLGLVRAAGFEAYGCWVSSRSEYFFHAATMQKDKLNANVVLVKVDGKDRYFDPGAAFTPYGMLPWLETAVTGLRLSKEGGSWIQTPNPEISQSRVERKAELKLNDQGDLEGKLTVTYTGLEAAYQRLEERHADAVARKKYLEDDLKEDVPAGVELELTGTPDWTTSDAPLVAEFTFKIAGWASGTNKRFMFPVGLFAAGERHAFDSTTRTHAVYRKFPSMKADDLTIELPAGWKILNVPEPKSMLYAVVGYENKAENANGKLHISRNLGINFILLPVQDYPSLRNFYSAVKSGDDEQVLLQPAAETN